MFGRIGWRLVPRMHHVEGIGLAAKSTIAWVCLMFWPFCRFAHGANLAMLADRCFPPGDLATVIPNNEQLLAIAHLEEGDLRAIPFGVLLHALAVTRRTVVLAIERSVLHKRILFEDGVPVDCSSNLLHETFGRFLVNCGTIDDAQAQAFLSRSVSEGIPLGEVVIRDGLMSASEVYRALQANLARKLLDGFSWREGAFRLLTEMPPIESALKIKVPQLVVTGIAKFSSQVEVDAAVCDLIGARLCLHPEPPYPLKDIMLSGRQERLVALLQDGKRIDELAAETSVPFPEIVRLLYALAILGLVIPESARPVAAPAAPEVVAVEPAIPSKRLDTQPLKRLRRTAVSASTEDSDAGLRDALMEAFLKHRKQDAYELLGLEENATLRQIEEAFLTFSDGCAPWRFASENLAPLREKAEDLFLAGGRAFGELSDRDRRDELLARRRRLRERNARSKGTDIFAIKSELLDSELQFKKGRALMDGGHHREALEQLAFAHDFDPQNSLYRCELAYCRFVVDPARYGDVAERELDETMRVDPRFGLAFYYGGLVKGRRADPDGAEACLRRAIKLMKPDRRPIEALKKLASEGGLKRR